MSITPSTWIRRRDVMTYSSARYRRVPQPASRMPKTPTRESGRQPAQERPDRWGVRHEDQPEGIVPRKRRPGARTAQHDEPVLVRPMRTALAGRKQRPPCTAPSGSPLSPSSGPRVGAGVDLSDAFACDVRVQLGRLAILACPSNSCTTGPGPPSRRCVAKKGVTQRAADVFAQARRHRRSLTADQAAWRPSGSPCVMQQRRAGPVALPAAASRARHAARSGSGPATPGPPTGTMRPLSPLPMTRT